MRKILCFALLFLASFAAAQTTPNLGLAIPPHNQPNWDVPLNSNFLQLDNYLSGGTALQVLKMNQYFDMLAIPAPSNPSAGYCRFYFDNGSGLLTGINSSGGACSPSGGSVPGVDTQLIFNCGGTALCGANGLNWSNITGAFNITSNNISLSSVGGFGSNWSLFSNSSTGQLFWSAADTTLSPNTLNLEMYTTHTKGQDCLGVSANTFRKFFVGQSGAFPQSLPLFCLDDNGIWVPTPAAGDSSQQIASTLFFKTPGPIGSITPNTGAFTTVTVTGATASRPTYFNSSKVLTAGTFLGNTFEFVTATGAFTNGDCAKFDSNFNLVDAGAPCGSGGSSGTISPGTTHQVPVYTASTTIGPDSSITDDGAGNLAGVVSEGFVGSGPMVFNPATGTSVSAPANGFAKFWVDSVTGYFTCIKDSGAANCMPPSGGIPGTPLSSVQANCSSVFCGTLLSWDGTSKFTCPGCFFQSDNVLAGVGIQNDPTTGTVQNKLAKINTSNGDLVLASTGDVGTGIPFYLIVNNAGTSGKTLPLGGGTGLGIFDGAVVAGHLWGASSTSGGSLHDLGTNNPTSLTSGTWYGGQIFTTNGSPGSTPQLVSIWQGGVAGGSGGGGNMNTASANTMGTGGTIDMSAQTGSNSFKLPVQSGGSTSVLGSMVIDSTAGKAHTYLNGADRVLCTTQGETGCTSGGNMSTSGANTMGTGGTIDASGQTGSNSFKIPVKAGVVATASGSFGYNTTSGNIEAGKGGTQVTVCTSAGETGCAAPTVPTGGYITLGVGGTSAAQGIGTINTTRLWSFIAVTYMATTSQFSAYISGVDNTSNLWNIAIFNTSGNIVCQLGPTAGSSLGGSSSGYKLSKSWSGGSCGPLILGQRYYIGLTGQGTTLTFGGQNGTIIPVCGVSPTSNGTTSGANWTTPIGIPTDSPTNCVNPNMEIN